MMYSPRDPEKVMEEQEAEEAKRVRVQKPLPPLLHGAGLCPKCGLYLVESDANTQEDTSIVFDCPRCGMKSNRDELKEVGK